MCRIIKTKRIISPFLCAILALCIFGCSKDDGESIDGDTGLGPVFCPPIEDGGSDGNDAGDSTICILHPPRCPCAHERECFRSDDLPDPLGYYPYLYQNIL